jgi:hypothetical protein
MQPRPVRLRSVLPWHPAAVLALLMFAASALLPLAAAAEEPDSEPAAQSPASGEMRFGLSLAQRQAIFRDLMAADSRAEQEAAKRNETDPESEQDVDLTQRLSTQYRDAVARHYGLSMEQLVAIGAEGYEKDWPAGPP